MEEERWTKKWGRLTGDVMVLFLGIAMLIALGLLLLKALIALGAWAAA